MLDRTPLCHQHLKVTLLCRFLKFHKDLIASPKFTIRCLARLATSDMRTTAGRTLTYLEKQCNIERGTWEKLSPQKVKSSLMYVSPPAGNEWISSLGSSLLQIRNGNLALPGFSSYEVDKLFHDVCTK